MGLIGTLMTPPCPRDDDWDEYRPGGIHVHDRPTVEAFWARIYRRFEDRALCQKWWDHRAHHSMKAWAYGFTEMTYKRQELAKEGIQLQHPFSVVKRKAEDYDRNPDLCSRLAERRSQQRKNQIAETPPPVAISMERRQWWEEYYRRRQAQKTG